MIIKNQTEYQAIKNATDISTVILQQLTQAVKPGVTPREIDQLAFELCQQHGCEPAFADVLGHNRKPYGFATCISVNDVAVHGLPDDRRFEPGDLVSVDFGLIKDGYYTDHCHTIGLDPVESRDKKLLEIGRKAVLAGVAQAVAGNTTGDIGHAMETTARQYHFDTIKQYIGHGIGVALHEEPEVPAFGKRGHGSQLVEGQLICVEAQVVAGDPNITVDSDQWSVRMADGKNSVMFEYMVIVRQDKPEILTETQNWNLIN